MQKDCCKTPRHIYRTDGVGIDLGRFSPAASEAQRVQLRQERGFAPEDFILMYTAEFIPRKNHRLLFAILPQLAAAIPCLQVVLCGRGALLEQYRRRAQETEPSTVTFTGYTTEVENWCRLSDVLVMPSLQEGLPLAMIEAMATGLPVVASNIRGHRDLLADGENGFLCDLGRPSDFARCITVLYKNPALRQEMGKHNVRAAQKFSLGAVVPAMEAIYQQMM